ncbi:MAG: hypothetical protein II882_02345 [Lachnospiraceae bacterium]|nr:hypothetical protein [Lachnospiraceae bacterium]
MRKIVVLILASCLIITISGCGKSNYDQEISRTDERLDALESLNAHSTELPDISSEPFTNDASESELPTQPQQSESAPLYDEVENSSETFSSTETDGTTENEVPTQPQQSESVPVYDEFKKLNQYSEMDGKLWDFYAYGFNFGPKGDVDSVDLTVELSEDWKSIEVGKRLVLELKNKWINAIWTIEADASITSREDCLQKVQEITAGFQSEGIKENEEYSPYASFINAISGESAKIPEGITGGKVNLDDTWWIEKISGFEGYEYYHEKSTHTGKDDIEYSLLEYGAFTYVPNNKLGGFHVTLNVTFYDFETYYESLRTEAEKIEANAEKYSMFIECNIYGKFYGLDLKQLLYLCTKVNHN